MKTENLLAGALVGGYFGEVPKDRALSFYRVETWKGGHFVADFALKSQAVECAIKHAKATGCRNDHKVSSIIMRGA